MASNEQNKLTNKIEALLDTEKRLTAVRGEGFEGLGKKGEEMKQSKQTDSDRQQYGDY